MRFDGGRSGLVPAWFAHLRPQVETQVNALLGMGGFGLGIITVWWVLHVIGAVKRDRRSLWGLYAECSTMGTILILSSTS